jgi:hypothetical protein
MNVEEARRAACIAKKIPESAKNRPKFANAV